RDRRADGARRMAAREALGGRVGVARAAIPVLGALGVGDAPVAAEGGRLGLAGELDLGLGRGLVARGVRDLQIGHGADELAGVGQPRVGVLGGHPRERRRLVHHPLERLAREIGRGGRCRGAAGEDAQRQPLVARVLHRVHLPQAHGGGEVLLLDQEAVGRGGAAGLGALENVDEQPAAIALGAHTWVPPTVMPSMRIVGSPTPTGTDWPSLPQVPTPSSSFKSCPTRLTRVSASGPLPISVAPFTGAVTLPFSIRYASLAENTNLPLVMSTCPPPKATA